MQKNLGIGIAEALECADHGPLLIDQPDHEHIEHQRRHGEKDRRHDPGERAEAGDLVGKKPVRRLFLAGDRRKDAERRQPRLRLAQDFVGVIADFRCKQSDHLICRTVKVEHFLRIRLRQVEDAEMLGVGRKRARADQIYKFARDCRADDEQLLTPVVQEQVQPLTWK